MAEIHGLGSWLGATTPSADEFLLPRHDCPVTPPACSSRRHMTLGAGRRSRAARPHVGDGPSARPGSHAHPKAQPTEAQCLQWVCRVGLSLTCPTEKHHLHNFFHPSFLQRFSSKRMQHLLFTTWRSRVGLLLGLPNPGTISHEAFRSPTCPSKLQERERSSRSCCSTCVYVC